MKRLFHLPERRFLSALVGSGFILGVLAFHHTDGAASIAIGTLGTLWGGLVIVQHLGERREKDKP